MLCYAVQHLRQTLDIQFATLLRPKLRSCASPSENVVECINKVYLLPCRVIRWQLAKNPQKGCLPFLVVIATRPMHTANKGQEAARNTSKCQLGTRNVAGDRLGQAVGPALRGRQGQNAGRDREGAPAGVPGRGAAGLRPGGGRGRLRHVRTNSHAVSSVFLFVCVRCVCVFFSRVCAFFLGCGLFLRASLGEQHMVLTDWFKTE